MKKLIPLLALVLVACQPAPSAYTPAPFTFESATTAPISMAVGRIDIVNHFQSTMKKPNVEHEFAVAPVAAVDRWLKQRIRAVGGNTILQITISDASALETGLKKTEGIKGLFTDDQDARYDARILVTYRLFDGTSIASLATGDVEVTRFLTINEKATVYERQKRFHEMLDAMLIDLEQESQKRFQQYFSGSLR